MVCSLAEDGQGRLWIGTGSWGSATGWGLNCYDGERFETFTTADGLPHDKVHATIEDGQGRLWFATAGGLCRREGEGFVAVEGLPPHEMTSLAVDRDDALWIATMGGGVCRYGDSVKVFTVEDGLSDNSVHALLIDDGGTLWCSTRVGLCRSGGDAFTSVLDSDTATFSDDVFPTGSLAADPEGNIWFGTSKGVCRYDGDRVEVFTVEDGLCHNISARPA
jgi:ligand-binding sensor domain-containing protein